MTYGVQEEGEALQTATLALSGSLGAPLVDAILNKAEVFGTENSETDLANAFVSQVNF